MVCLSWSANLTASNVMPARSATWLISHWAESLNRIESMGRFEVATTERVLGTPIRLAATTLTWHGCARMAVSGWNARQNLQPQNGWMWLARADGFIRVNRAGIYFVTFRPAMFIPGSMLTGARLRLRRWREEDLLPTQRPTILTARLCPFSYKSPCRFSNQHI
jgi:hypothetical protein